MAYVQQGASMAQDRQVLNLRAFLAMVGFFRMGCEVVRWELTAMRPDGPYRLAIQFSAQPVVELFEETSMALLRIAEIENLLTMPPVGRPS
jgi:hypothetical protein